MYANQSANFFHVTGRPRRHKLYSLPLRVASICQRNAPGVLSVHRFFVAIYISAANGLRDLDDGVSQTRSQPTVTQGEVSRRHSQLRCGRDPEREQ